MFVCVYQTALHCICRGRSCQKLKSSILLPHPVFQHPRFSGVESTQCRAAEPVARVPKMAHGKISLARGIHCCPSLFNTSFPRPASLYYSEHVYIYTHISDCVQTVHELPLLPNNTAVKHLNTNPSGVKSSKDIYRWGAGLAVTGPTRDIGQNVLQSSFETASSSSSHSYCHILFLLHSSRRLYYKYNNYTAH